MLLYTNGQNIDLILTLNVSSESKFLISVPKEFHRLIVEAKKDYLNFTVRHEIELTFSLERSER